MQKSLDELIVRSPKDFPKYELKHCPFCGSNLPQLINTHTPSYWIECECGCELHSCGDYNNTKQGHKKSALEVIEKWNERY